MGDVRFEHSSAGYVELMKSAGMRGILKEYASGIESAAEGSMSDDKGTPLANAPYKSVDFEGRDRAGVRVQTNNPHARNAEAKYGFLQNAAGV